MPQIIHLPFLDQKNLDRLMESAPRRRTFEWRRKEEESDSPASNGRVPGKGRADRKL